MADSGQFRDNWYGLATPWLSTGNAEKYLYTLQVCSDVLLDKMNQAVLIRMPGQGHPSQIPWLANDRALVQGPAESNAAFVLRLQLAFAAWKHAGASNAVLEQLKAYIQGLQPGVAATMPGMTIVGGDAAYTKWTQFYVGDAVGKAETLTTVTPANWNWDGHYATNKAWLVLFMSLVATGQSGSSAATSTAAGTAYGTGSSVAGVWVPNSASALTTPFITITGLTSMGPSNVGQWLTLSGSSHSGNNGTFPITQALSISSCVIANPGGVTSDAGPLTWSIGSYPFIGPGPVWGAPGYVYGQGQQAVPPISVGSRVGGIWEPELGGDQQQPTISWGLTCSANTIQSIRQILSRWKSAGTFYPDIVVAFDGSTGVAGSAFSPNSTTGSGNPDGTFGGRGKNVAGVWVPNRLVTSNFNAWCQGTGSWPGGNAEVT